MTTIYCVAIRHPSNGAMEDMVFTPRKRQAYQDARREAARGHDTEVREYRVVEFPPREMACALLNGVWMDCKPKTLARYRAHVPRTRANIEPFGGLNHD